MTDQYAVIGSPTGHSKSRRIHGMFARTTGETLRYTAIEATTENLTHTVLAFRDAGGRGMNVTAPFKLQAFDLSTHRMERARLAGAAHALKLEGDHAVATR